MTSLRNLFKFEHIWIFMCIFELYSCGHHVESARMPIKIVKEPANYGFFGNALHDSDSQEHLVARVQPSNFSGPSHLKELVGKCFNLTKDQYQYNFCPFHNVTQHELIPRWNAYRGILGVWNEWIIKNNTFIAMMFRYGDMCGETERTIMVDFHCSKKEELTNVTEPKRCQYRANFSTPLICHKDAMLVYPRLSVELRRQWDMLETEFQSGDITEMGYESSLRRIFEEVGFQNPFLPLPTENTTSETTTKENIVSLDNFSDLSQCNKAYRELKQEINDLKKELESVKLLLELNSFRNEKEKNKEK